MPSAEIKPEDKRGDCASDGAPMAGLVCRDIYHVPLSMKECTSFPTNHGPIRLDSFGKCLSLSSATGGIGVDRPPSAWRRVSSLFGNRGPASLRSV